MENYYGCVWETLMGWIITQGSYKVKLTHSTQDGSTASDYNIDGTGYIAINGAIPSGGNGYIQEELYDSLGVILPIKTGGSKTTYYGDYLAYTSNTEIMAVGDSMWHTGSLIIGIFSAGSFATTRTDVAISAKLSCKPSL